MPMALNQRPLAKRRAALSAYEPSYRENVEDLVARVAGGLGADKHRARDLGRRLTGLAEWTPFGLLTSYDDAKRAAAQGDVGGTAMAAIGAVPVVGKARRAKKLLKAAEGVEVPLASKIDPTNPTPTAGLGVKSTVKASKGTEVPAASVVDPTLNPPKGIAAQQAKTTAKAETVKGLGGIRAYHGSPHSFEEFDISKIGTGEGAQAYGHGLYFAENEGVARQYRDNLARPDFNVTDSGAAISSDLSRILEDSYDDAMRQGVSAPTHRDAIHLAQQNLDRQRADALKAGDFDWFNKVSDQINELQRMGKDAPKTQGSMYEVNIAADPEHFLDWEKPLSEQSDHAKAALRKGFDQRYGEGFFDKYAATGADFRDIQNNFDDLEPSDISNMLRSGGAPGIKYLDQGSRNPTTVFLDGKPIASNDYVAQAAADALGTYGTHEAAIKALGAHPGYRNTNRDAAELLKSGRLTTPPQSRNYVVFDPKLISIVKKYGIPAAVAAGLISEEMGRQMQEQGEL